jgi:hypothetical protein
MPRTAFVPCSVDLPPPVAVDAREAHPVGMVSGRILFLKEDAFKVELGRVWAVFEYTKTFLL